MNLSQNRNLRSADYTEQKEKTHAKRQRRKEKEGFVISSRRSQIHRIINLIGHAFAADLVKGLSYCEMFLSRFRESSSTIDFSEFLLSPFLCVIALLREISAFFWSDFIFGIRV